MRSLSGARLYKIAHQKTLAGRGIAHAYRAKEAGRVASSFLAIGSMLAGRMLDAAGHMLARMCWTLVLNR